MDLMDTIHISSAGMKVQSERLKVVAQNIANSESTANTPGGQPYRRKTISFKEQLDRETGIEMVAINKRGNDNSDFMKKYEPTNPAADDQGYVLYPNVNTIMESMDMREARRGYEANLNVIESSKAMVNQTLGLLK